MATSTSISTSISSFLIRTSTSLNDQNRFYVSASLAAAVPLFLLWTWRRRSLAATAPAKMAQTPSKTVVVVGGSWAGINVAHGVLKQVPNAKVILINPTDDFYFNLASVRILAKPGAIPREKYLYQISPLFEVHPNRKTHFEFILGKATSIDLKAKKVSVTENSAATRELAYDYLVIASGSTSNAAKGKDSLKAPFKHVQEAGKIDDEIKSAQDVIKSAKSIVIGGAGAVGVEFAGELVEGNPSIDITLISNNDGVLAGLKESARQRAAKLLKAKGVKVLTNTTVNSSVLDSASGKWTVSLSDGQTLTTDAYFSITGALPNNEFIPASILNKDGWVEVDNRFKVTAAESNDSVYAIGDITHYTARLASRLPGQVPVLVSNLKADITGKGKRTVYDANQSLIMVVPIGKSTGTGQLGSLTAPGFMVSLIKGRDFFTGQAKKFVSA